MSNSGDEILLYAPNADLTATGALLDRFDYPDGFAPEGASMGVDWSNATPTLNDDLYEWCQHNLLGIGQTVVILEHPTPSIDLCF